MLIDLLNSASYIMINLDAINLLGLTNAAYCAELLTIFKKAVKKKKTYNDVFFKVDRDYIEERLKISPEDQLKCDINLSKVDIIKISDEDPDIISIDVEKYASLLACEDVKLQEKITQKVTTVNPKGVKKSQTDRVIIALKESIECKTPEVLFALKDWIDSIFASGKGMSKIQVKLFKDKIDDYCNGDLQKALEIIKLATIHSYIDCQWAINIYEGNNKKFIQNQKSVTNIRVTEQKISTELSAEQF